MSEFIVYKNKDGSCGIIVPTPEILIDKTIEQVAKKDVPAGLEWRIVKAADLPADRTFRDAWTDDNDTETVDVCIKKAKKVVIQDKAELKEKVDKIDNLEELKKLWTDS